VQTWGLRFLQKKTLRFFRNVGIRLSSSTASCPRRRNPQADRCENVKTYSTTMLVFPIKWNYRNLGRLYRGFSVSVCRKRRQCLFPPRTRHMLSSTVICVTTLDVIIKWQWCRLLPNDSALQTRSYNTATQIASSLVLNLTVYSCCNRNCTYKQFGRNHVLHCFCDTMPRACLQIFW